MTTSQGLGRRRPGLLAFVPWSNVFGLGPGADDTGKVMATELYFGGYPPPVVEIPYSWIRPALRIRQASPLNVAEVTQSGGSTSRSVNVPSTTTRQWLFTATVDSAVPVDPANLAKWVTDTYDVPLPRSSALGLVLNDKSETEIWWILGVRQGTHIRITGAPAGWPTGATELVVEGIAHQITADVRTVVWNTSPVVGSAAGVVGPWFYSEDSLTSGADVVPF
jgi:hypothetical protein